MIRSQEKGLGAETMTYQDIERDLGAGMTKLHDLERGHVVETILNRTRDLNISTFEQTQNGFNVCLATLGKLQNGSAGSCNYPGGSFR